MHRLDRIQDGTNASVWATVARLGLWLASQPYGLVVAFRNRLYDREWIATERAAVPVVSIGNLTAGGTGKSPTCVFLARWFRQRGLRVAILSRGYKALQDGMNDEAKELEILLPDVPHLQSPDRVATAKIAVEELEMEVLLLDDGFQHRRLQRDLDIVLLDATEPFGYGFLLPRGMLREPRRALRRADIVLATRADQVDGQQLASIRTTVQRYNPRAAWIEAEHAGVGWYNASGIEHSLESKCGLSVLAVSAIGNPRAFEATLRRQGLDVVDHLIFPDHHPFSQQDIAGIERRASGCSVAPQAIVCTGKDLAKLGADRLGRWELWALKIEMRIRTGADILDEHLVRITQAAKRDRNAADSIFK